MSKALSWIKGLKIFYYTFQSGDSPTECWCKRPPNQTWGTFLTRGIDNRRGATGHWSQIVRFKLKQDIFHTGKCPCINPLCANRNKSRLLFSSAEMFKKPLWQTVWTQIRLLIRAVCSGSTLFASILNSSVMLGNYLQQTTSADNIFICIFFLGALRVNSLPNIACWKISHVFLSSGWTCFHLYPPQTLFVGGILFSRCPCVRPSVRPSVRASVRPSVRP